MERLYIVQLEQVKFKLSPIYSCTKLTLSTFDVEFRIKDLNGDKAFDVSTNDRINSMLIKQRKYTKIEKTEVANMKIVKEYNMKPMMDYKGIKVPVRPPKIMGYAMKIGKMLGGKNRRFFALDPIEGNLIKYMQKEDFPKNHKDIYCLANITNLERVLEETGYSIKVRVKL
jgi:hypothetical protein